MDKKLQKLKEKVADALKEKQIEVTDISFEKEGNYYFLRIELDKINGLDIDAVVDATNIINPIVDEEDITDESYILDVVSKERGDKNE